MLIIMNAAVGTYCIYQNPGVWPKVKVEMHISAEGSPASGTEEQVSEPESGAAWPSLPGVIYLLPVSLLAQEKVTSFINKVDASALMTSFLPFPLLRGQKPL